MEDLEIYSERKHCKNENRTVKNILLGIFFIFIGGAILGNRTGLMPDWIFDIIISWQMLLVAIGLISVTSKKSIIPGVILIIVGGTFLLPKIFNMAFEISHLWLPALLIAIGFIVIFKTFSKTPHQNKGFKFNEDFSTFSNDYIKENYIFGGGNMHVNSTNFKGGKISAIFGGGKFDFREAILSTEGKNILEVDLIFGGIEILVPHDWNVIIEVNSVFGGFNFKKNGISNANIDFTKELIIKGSAVFGGGEIKRY